MSKKPSAADELAAELLGGMNQLERVLIRVGQAITGVILLVVLIFAVMFLWEHIWQALKFVALFIPMATVTILSDKYRN